MRKGIVYVIFFIFASALFLSCGKETSEALISFNPDDVENNGNTYNQGCLECDLFTWCDNSQYIYVPNVMGTGQPQYTHKYKNVSRKRVGTFEFTGTVVKTGDTIFHNCQNNVTRILTKDGNDILKKVNGDGIEGETWTDTYSNGDTVVNYKITGIDLATTVFGKTFNSTVTVQEKKFFTDGSSNTADWILVTQTDNVYARDRISAARISGVGLIQQTVKNPAGNTIFQLFLKSYTLP